MRLPRRAKQESHARHHEDGATVRGISPLVRMLLDKRMRALLARMARLFEAEGSRHDEVDVLLRTLERKGALGAVVNLARGLERHSVSWAELGKLADGPPSRPGLRELVTVFSSEESDRTYHVVPDIYGRNFHLRHDIREDADFKEAADHVIGRGTSLLYYDRLHTLYESIRNVSRLYPDARLNVVEVGVYRGGTSFFLCELLRKLHGSHARFYAIDTFEGHSAIDLPRGMEGRHSPKEFEKTMMSAPMPLSAVKNSATIMEITPRPTASRTPAITNGMELGSTTLLSTWRLLAP